MSTRARKKQVVKQNLIRGIFQRLFALVAGFTKDSSGKNKHKWSDGIYHLRISLVLSLLLLPLGFIDPRLLFISAGCLLGIIVSPDLDLDFVFNISSTIFLRIPLVGWILTYIWSAFWHPYAYAFRHRGSSHTPIIGTITRVSYMLVMVPIFLFVLCLFSSWYLSLYGAGIKFDFFTIFESYKQFLLVFYPYLGLISAGVMVSDVGHWARDNFGLQI